MWKLGKTMLVSLNNYASQHRRSSDTIRRLAEKGMFKTAKKIARNWVVDDTEPYPLLKRDPIKKYKFIDLFAGIGGIRLGFEKAFGKDSETVFVSEWDAAAQKTYLANFPDTKAIAGDITKIDENDVPPFNICLAGFPCQAFSMAGQRKGFDDNYKGICRGTLFLDVARICDYRKPEIIFCENVKGLAIHDKGRTFKVIKSTFENLGYTVFSKILNSKDFGVPQNRERLYIVAFKNKLNIKEFNFPEPTDSTKVILNIMEEKPVSAKYYLSNTYVETLKRHKA